MLQLVSLVKKTEADLINTTAFSAKSIFVTVKTTEMILLQLWSIFTQLKRIFPKRNAAVWNQPLSPQVSNRLLSFHVLYIIDCYKDSVNF